jgi:hypothetical protein
MHKSLNSDIRTQITVNFPQWMMQSEKMWLKYGEHIRYDLQHVKLSKLQLLKEINHLHYPQQYANITICLHATILLTTQLV